MRRSLHMIHRVPMARRERPGEALREVCPREQLKIVSTTFAPFRILDGGKRTDFPSSLRSDALALANAFAMQVFLSPGCPFCFPRQFAKLFSFVAKFFFGISHFRKNTRRRPSCLLHLGFTLF